MKRPGILTVLCVCLWVGNVAMLAFAGRVNVQALGFPPWFAAYGYALSVVNILSGVGIWQLRRWGLVLAALSIAVSQSVLLALHHWGFASLAVCAVELGILLKHRRVFR